MTDTAPLTDPASCGSCRHHVTQGRAALHEQCIARAQLIPAPDAPCYETILDTPEDQRAQLPARFHIPVYDDAGTPKSWTCAVCWGDGWATRWPCASALENGRDVFTPEHLADQGRQDVPALLAEVERLRAELAQEQQVSQDRGRYLAEVDAALIAAGEDEGGGYIAYPRRIAQLAADRDRARAELEQAQQKAAAHEHSENLLAGIIRDGRQLLAEATSPEQAVTDLHTLLNP